MTLSNQPEPPLTSTAPIFMRNFVVIRSPPYKQPLAGKAIFVFTQSYKCRQATIRRHLCQSTEGANSRNYCAWSSLKYNTHSKLLVCFPRRRPESVSHCARPTRRVRATARCASTEDRSGALLVPPEFHPSWSLSKHHLSIVNRLKYTL